MAREQEPVDATSGPESHPPGPPATEPPPPYRPDLDLITYLEKGARPESDSAAER